MVRESQEVVELVLKGLLRIVGVDPPKEHDVSKQLAAQRNRLPRAVSTNLREIGRLSKRLRRERELAFYGNEDFVRSDEYDADDSDEAIAAADAIVGWVRAGLDELSAG